MILDNTNFWHSPVRSFTTRVELYQSSALADTYTAHSALKSFSIERVGEESKFFGFGVCQKMNLKLIDKDRLITITTEHSLKPYLSTGGTLVTPCPAFYVTRVNRDENTNELSITAYDVLYKAADHTVNELSLTAPYTILGFAEACSELLGCEGVDIQGLENTDCFDTSYEEGANFDGTEDIRSALNAIAEATQTIYYINSENNLVFKRLDMTGLPVLKIEKADYITLESGENRRLGTIIHVTELGDNVYSRSTSTPGSTQYIRSNPFWDLREDIHTLLDNAIAAVGGLTINQFNCVWRGNFCLEIGDKITLNTKNSDNVLSYVLDDVITYDGSLSQETQWSYTEDEAETDSNPTSLGEALNQTFARVDKANKQITLVVNDINVTKSAIDSELEIIKEQQTSFTQTAEDITIRVESIETNGATKVNTGTGFTFNEEGLRINKDNSGIENLIDNTGMYVKQDGTEVLVANEDGVKAKDLHAVTYLWIGSHSRFEDYEGNRTGCFWIGQ